MSDLINSLIGDEDELGDNTDFNVVEVSSAILKKVIEYCRYYQEEEKMLPFANGGRCEKFADKIQPDWYANYCKDSDHETLFQLCAASTYMGIKPLNDMACMAISLKISGKSTDELRQIFHLPDIVPDEN